MTETTTLTRGERTRTEIVQAAHALFLEKGYNGASIRQIADRAGIALGGIYNHFGSKADIFAAVFAERHPYLQIVPLIENARGDNFEDLLRAIAYRMMEVLRQRPDFLNLMFIEMIELKGVHMPGFVQQTLPRLGNFIQQYEAAQASGQLRPLPVFIFLRAFLGMFVSYAITEQIAGSLPEQARVNGLDYFIDIFLHGVLAQAPDARHLQAQRSASGPSAAHR